ncbi:hypothetical protein FRC07_009728 [Ceratobasidium sp. 392]|nr:hypothetical protein FRC07_009728 [Ceratobasidium sp. 392]
MNMHRTTKASRSKQMDPTKSPAGLAPTKQKQRSASRDKLHKPESEDAQEHQARKSGSKQTQARLAGPQKAKGPIKLINLSRPAPRPPNAKTARTIPQNPALAARSRAGRPHKWGEKTQKAGAAGDANTSIDMRPQISNWEGGLVRLCVEQEELEEDQAEVLVELEEAKLSGAVLRFMTLGSIFGLVNLNEDPSACGNPRGLSDPHIKDIYQSIRLPNKKKNHSYPIHIAVNPDLVPDDTLADILKADATDIRCLPPWFRLEGVSNKDEDLENTLWTRRKGKAWLSNAELHEKKRESDALRGLRKLVKLLNWNHRIWAMLKCNDKMVAKQGKICELMQKGKAPPDEVTAIQAELEKQVKRTVWRCVVDHENKLTDRALNYLIWNKHLSPAKGMCDGERAWWLAKKFNHEIAAEMNKGKGKEKGKGLIERPEAAGIVQAQWWQELGMKMAMTGQDKEGKT